MDRQNLVSILEALAREMESGGEPSEVDIAGCLYALSYAIRLGHERELSHCLMSFANEQMEHDKQKPS